MVLRDLAGLLTIVLFVSSVTTVGELIARVPAF